MGPWNVVYHLDVLPEYEAIRDRRARKAIARSVDVLSKHGPAAREPHAKQVRGTSGLWELRPAGGTVLFRPLYARVGTATFVVLTIAPEAVVDPSGFEAAVRRARDRGETGFGLSL